MSFLMKKDFMIGVNLEIPRLPTHCKQTGIKLDSKSAILHTSMKTQQRKAHHPCNDTTGTVLPGRLGWHFRWAWSRQGYPLESG